jgi:hypothetical protein
MTNTSPYSYINKKIVLGDPQEIELWRGGYWIYLKRRAVVHMGMKIWVPQNAGDFLSI